MLRNNKVIEMKIRKDVSTMLPARWWMEGRDRKGEGWSQRVSKTNKNAIRNQITQASAEKNIL